MISDTVLSLFDKTIRCHGYNKELTACNIYNDKFYAAAMINL